MSGAGFLLTHSGTACPQRVLNTQPDGGSIAEGISPSSAIMFSAIESSGSGVGTALMSFVHCVARENALDSVWCNAQVSAVSFYEQLGYRITSAEPFDEAGIPHVRMECSL